MAIQKSVLCHGHGLGKGWRHIHKNRLEKSIESKLVAVGHIEFWLSSTVDRISVEEGLYSVLLRKVWSVGQMRSLYILVFN